MYKIGFIGCGNMAKAMIGGMITSGKIAPEEILASNRSIPSLIEMKEKYGIQITQNNAEVAESCDFVILSVTPDMYASVIEEIKNVIKDETIVILIAAGQTIAENEERFGKKIKIAKAMPNTPVLVGEGVTAVSVNEQIQNSDCENIRQIFESYGKVEFIEERLMDIASAISGSSPAFVYLFIEALADSAVMYGMPRNLAYSVAAQTVMGSAKMVFESGKHPAQLKDEVCSPGGSTIQSIASLEENGFRSAIIQAVKANLGKLNK